MQTAANPSYCADTVRKHRRDHFLLSLFVPAEKREILQAAYALDAELAHVHRAVNEEMIGQIRYAWWQEALTEIINGKPVRTHPVLQALTPEMAAACLPLVDLYRAHYPEFPPGHDDMIEEISLSWLHETEPKAVPGWRKARDIIAGHRRRFGNGNNGWLSLKLLWAGR